MHFTFFVPLLQAVEVKILETIPRAINRNMYRQDGLYELSDFVVEGHVKQGQIPFITGGILSLGHFIARTSGSRVPLEKLIVLQPVKEFPAFDQTHGIPSDGIVPR